MKREPFRSWSCNKGFTLVELLICFLVLGILVAIGSGGMAHFRDQAKRNATLSEMKEVQVALKGYLEILGVEPDLQQLASHLGHVLDGEGKLTFHNRYTLTLENREVSFAALDTSRYSGTVSASSLELTILGPSE